VQKARRDAVLLEAAARHGTTPFEIALAWVSDVSDVVLPLPGPTRVETAQSIARARLIALTAEDRARLDESFPAGRALRPQAAGAPADRPVPERPDGEVVLIMGLPGAGKSTLARSFVAQGYTRLNRDAAGGSLRELLPPLDSAIAAGRSRFVLDNTYVSRKSRAAVVQAARQRGLPIRCVWLSTSVEDAQVNVAWRALSDGGRLEAASFGPGVQFRYQRELEPPDPSERFSRVDVMPFERRHEPSFLNRAVIVWCDGVLSRSRSGSRTPASAEDVEVFAERAEVLRRYQAAGWRVLGLSWQPAVAEGTMSAAAVDTVFARMQELLGLSIEIEYCPHAAGPPACWCRKPLPGLGVVFIQRHQLDTSQCIYVGEGAQDPGFARRLGFQYRSVDDFFGATTPATPAPGA
jgi:histidinol phosphatase-like enzyme